jgi:carbon-monoxide dehydrogenase large subunit
MPVLASDIVRFVGQPIAMVVAQTALQARDAAEQVVVDYEELPVAATVEAALAPGAVQLHEAAPVNLALTYEDGDAEAVDRAFADAAMTSTLRIRSQRLVGSPLELRACVAAQRRRTRRDRRAHADPGNARHALEPACGHRLAGRQHRGGGAGCRR